MALEWDLDTFISELNRNAAGLALGEVTCQKKIKMALA